MDAYHLSQRLQLAAKYVPEQAFLADIGSDHAYLPANLALNHRIKQAIAGEIVSGPYKNACREIERLDLSSMVITRQADGLAALKPTEEVDAISICGMGGALICQILTAGWEQLKSFTRLPRLILQPNVGSMKVRRWLQVHRYQIIAEEILEEDGHIYEIIVADPGKTQQLLTNQQLLFGPFLLAHQDPPFQKKWSLEIEKLKKVLVQLQRAQTEPLAKEKQLLKKIKMIEGVLNDKG
ncbi:tRNA (adenine(22)-N(1))-methyltransferase [Liquorilactobacillus sicerae]|uniref:tRNA (adenine(22)-N(1))-methyltransferase n=1 Tax=Liquorilactobacillus sicerae TaxID=1416943 RepID=UPI0024806512|nr:tRNA (adenine(22)-N(1))-methyltransferase TrmK [Liquorilactobacillus sicerae]